MKIGLDVSQTCAERAGCAWYADAVARALVAAGLPQGHTFELYHHFGEWINADTRRGTVIEDPRVASPLRDLSPSAARAFWQDMADGKPLPGQPDVVFSFNFQAPKIPGTKLVYTVHDLAFWSHPEFATDETRLVCQRGLLQATARATGFLFVSHHTRDEFERFLPEWLQQQARPHLVAPGASRFASADAPAPANDAAPWLSVGSLEPRKNHAAVFAAYELYWNHSTQRRPLALVGGPGWKSEALHTRIAELKARGMPVHHFGYVPETEMAAHYASAFALLAPSWHEGFGLPLVEALTAGLPVIASDRASLPEVGGAAPIYFPPDRPDALADEMLALENDPAARDRRATASLERGREFSWAATAKSILEFAQRL